MMLSESSSYFFSICLISASISSVLIPKLSIALLSLSNNLIAYHLLFETLLKTLSSIFLSVSSISSAYLWLITCILPAALTASLAHSSTPVPFSADISTTLQPSSLDSFSTLILSPFLLTTSIILMAQTTGIPISRSCVVKYKFLSKFEPSIIFKITSGFSLIR